MKIVQFKTPGPPSVLDYVEVPTPEPQAGEVLVRAHAIGVGMPDVMIRRGVYNWMPPLPAAPGTEMSGIVEKIGPGVTRFKPGQRVVVSARDRPHRGGCYAEYNATPETSVYALPDGADMDQAAALANYQVAYHLLYDCTAFKKGQSVLVQGAAGGTGSALIDLARGAGLEVIGICSGAAKIDFVKSCGVEHVVDRQRDDIGTAVNAATDGKGGFHHGFRRRPGFRQKLRNARAVRRSCQLWPARRQAIGRCLCRAARAIGQEFGSARVLDAYLRPLARAAAGGDALADRASRSRRDPAAHL
jgi:NADPH:quinone reductase